MLPPGSWNYKAIGKESGFVKYFLITEGYRKLP
jgi:hypothetical protein